MQDNIDNSRELDEREIYYCKVLADFRREFDSKTDPIEQHYAVDVFLARHGSDPHFGHAVLNTCQMLRRLLSGGQTVINVINNHGDGNLIQSGSNSASAGTNLTVGIGNEATGAKPETLPLSSSPYSIQIVLPIAICLMIAALATWWILPQTCAFGWWRPCVTIFISVFLGLIGFFGILQFRRKYWEKNFLYSLGLPYN